MKDKRMKFRVNSKLILIIVVVLCLCSIAYGITVYSKMDKPFDGTYRTMDRINGCFLILRKDSSYMIYEEYNILDEGTYQVEYTYEQVRVCRLDSERNSKFNRVINFNGQECMILEQENNIFMKKISDVAVYINLGETGVGK